MVPQRFAILCVDDEAENVQMLMRVLRDTYDVFGAASGPEGLEILRTQRIHAVISDQRMPEMTGLEFLQKAHEINEDLLLFMASGYLGLSLVIEAVKQERIHGYFQKPLDAPGLRLVLKREFRRYALEQQNRELLAETQALNTELRRLNAVKSELLRMISHELLVPLKSIAGFAKLLAEKRETLREQDYQVLVGALQSQGGGLSCLIQDLSLLLEFESHGVRLERQDVNLAPILEELLAAFRARIEAQRLQIVVNRSDRLDIHADPIQVSRVLHNVVENCINHAPRGATINLEIEGHGDLLEVRVSGPGAVAVVENEPRIPEGTLAIDYDLARRFGGNGIGLAIAKAIVEAHGGRFRYESQPGLGSMFRFDLPVAGVEPTGRSGSAEPH